MYQIFSHFIFTIDCEELRENTSFLFSGNVSVTITTFACNYKETKPKPTNKKPLKNKNKGKNLTKPQTSKNQTNKRKPYV